MEVDVVWSLMDHPGRIVTGDVLDEDSSPLVTYPRRAVRYLGTIDRPDREFVLSGRSADELGAAVFDPQEPDVYLIRLLELRRDP